MFKNYLTHHFALGFERICFEIQLPAPEKQELTRCATQMMHFLEQALRCEKMNDRCRQLFVSLTYLRDCEEILEKAGLMQDEPQKGRFGILQARLEALCLKASEAEKGQIRMLG